MSLHIRLAGAGEPLAEVSGYVLGMPHLCPNGLSENWLWKELGHRHWNLIAKAYGRAMAGFGSEGERPIYAAFRNISLQGGDLSSVRENDTLDVRSTITHLSESRVVSRHVAACRDRLVADVAMTSVFVRRQVDGVNRSITRVRMGGGEESRPFPRPRSFEPAGRGHGGLPPAEGADAHELGTVLIDPCPHLDFNGAGLLYFSSFIAAVDRAEWRLLGKSAAAFVTRRRRAVFHGNIEIGEDFTVRILTAQDGLTSRRRARLCASTNGRLLAEVMTDRSKL